MARYLKSLTTGVVLPYVEASLKNADVREMSAEECAEYEASIGKTPEPEIVPVVEPSPEPEPEPEPAEIETGTVVTHDFEEGEPDAEAVLKALEVD